MQVDISCDKYSQWDLTRTYFTWSKDIAHIGTSRVQCKQCVLHSSSLLLLLPQLLNGSLVGGIALSKVGQSQCHLCSNEHPRQQLGEHDEPASGGHCVEDVAESVEAKAGEEEVPVGHPLEEQASRDGANDGTHIEDCYDP